MKKLYFFSVLILLTACTPTNSNSSVDMSVMDHSMMGHGDMMSNTSGASAFSSSTEGLPDVGDSQTVELSDGDTYALTATIVKKNIDGKTVKMLAYNDSIPGPLLKVRQDSTIMIDFTNQTDVESSIHSHGIRLENAFDGTHYVQDPVQPGGTFRYKLKFPDPGMYWYHPHFREDYAQESGLYGNILVVPKDPDYWSPVDREVAVFVDDLLMDDDGIVSFSQDAADHALMGRFGNVFLLNGKTDYELRVNRGETVRFFFTNAANTRVFNLRLPNLKMKLVGSDGGRYEQEKIVDEILIAPSERFIVEVSFDALGSFTLQHETPEKVYQLGKIIVDDARSADRTPEKVPELRQDGVLAADREKYESSLSTPPDKSLRLTVEMMGMGGMMMDQHPERIEWEDTMAMMNQMSTSESVTWQMVDEESGKINEAIDWTFKKGELVKIRVFNDPHSMHPMQHPIHLHGQRFLVLATNGIVNDNFVWKDTALIQTGDSVDLLVDMSNPGMWMLHCHIAEHLESEMMLGFKVL